MISHDFIPRGVCTRMIHVELDDAGKTIENVSFHGGCPGNLAAISKLLTQRATPPIRPRPSWHRALPRQRSTRRLPDQTIARSNLISFEGSSGVVNMENGLRQ